MEKKNNKGIILAIIILVVVLAGLGIGIVMLNSKGNNEQGDNNQVKNESNINNNTVENESAGIKPEFTKETYPKVDGATAMKPMSVEIAKSLLGMPQEEAEEFIVHNTTAQAYENLINKKTDLIFVSEPSDAILKDAEDAGVEFEMVGIGRDGFVFVENKENPNDNLTIEQIQKIYTGEITNWSQVGGEDLEIVAYQREANSGSQNLMEKMVMKGLKMMKAPQSLEISTMDGLMDKIASTYTNTKNSIGYSIYLYAKEQYVKDSVKFVSINGVQPSDETIADGSYPLSKIVYAIYRKDEKEDSDVRKLVEWLKTEEGQKTVEAGGYVPLKNK